MRGLHFVLVLFAGALALPAVARAACTDNGPAPSFDVSVKDPPVTYDYSVDSAKMASIAGANAVPGLGRDRTPFGLTIGRYDLEIVADTDTVRYGSAYCAHLRAAHVVVGLKQLDVLVDRRFADGTCQRNTIVAHERQHVEVFREAIRYYEPQIERALAATKLPPVVAVADRDAARAAFLEPLTEALRPIFEAINGRARDGNMRLDAPESYAEVFTHCASW
jgi:hypothetical protein